MPISTTSGSCPSYKLTWLLGRTLYHNINKPMIKPRMDKSGEKKNAVASHLHPSHRHTSNSMFRPLISKPINQVTYSLKQHPARCHQVVFLSSKQNVFFHTTWSNNSPTKHMMCSHIYSCTYQVVWNLSTTNRKGLRSLPVFGEQKTAWKKD